MTPEKLKEIRDKILIKNTPPLSAVRQYDEKICDSIQRETALAVIEEILAMELGVNCADCDNSGIIPIQVGEDEFEAQQCEFCYTFIGSKFDIRNKLNDKLAELKKEIEK